MKYCFSAIYVLGVVIIVLNICQLFISGWDWGPIIRILIAVIWLYLNYRFMKECFKAENQRKHPSQKKENTQSK